MNDQKERADSRGEKVGEIEEDITPTVEGIYKFWFGKGDLNAPNYVHNGKLWWKGLPEVDRKMKLIFGDLVEKALAEDSMFAEWKKTVKGNIALILLLDQFTRNVYRGDPKMFSGDKLAVELAKSLIELKLDLSVSPAERLFIYMPLQHSENIEECQFGVEKIKELVESCTVVQKRKFNSLVTGFEKHAAIVSVFGRYPHRNQLLQRISTHEEEAFLEKNAKSTNFMKSIYKKPDTDNQNENENNKSGSKPKRKGVKPNPNDPKPLEKPLAKVLVLHSFRQNASVMKKRSNKLRKAFAKEGIELVYVNAPISYEAQGEDKEVVLKAFEKLPPTEHQRCFWTSKDENSVYEGIDVSIRYLVDLFATQGPFLGVMAFSHGACMGAILAALQPLESVKFEFCILISGFPPRDVAHKDLFLPKTQKMPSLHILGHKDLLVDNARTRALCDAFQDSVLLEHSAGHFVPDSWPVEHMAKFAAKFLDKDAPTKVQDLSVVLNTFIAKLEATIVHGVIGEPVGISAKARTVLSSELWKTWKSNPCDISLNSIRNFVCNTLELAASPEEQDVLVEDLFVIAFSGRMNKIPSKKLSADPNVLKTDELFSQVVAILYTLSSYAAKLLGLMTKFCGWRDLVGTAVQAYRIGTISNDSGEKQKLETLQQEIIQLFGSQLSKDLIALSKPNGMPSSCVIGAPRTKSAPNKEMKIALSVAFALHPQNEKLSDLAKKTKVERAYNQTLRELTLRLQTATAVDATRKQLKRTALETNYVSQFSLSLPVPVSIANPEPEPVTVAPLEELQPLFEHLKANFPVPQQISFVRGSLLPDGRLDLCKMVVGKTGIKPLLEAMEGNDAVKRLLLGNNVVGDQGAKFISEFINKGSKLTTWYIAGNDITAEGIEPICKALENDPRVEQLWLKRNPLMPSGALHLSHLLRNNSYLQVLDLVNTGMLDEGTITIMEALKDNTTLRHLYLGTNGITSKSCPAIKDYLTHHNRLQSLYLSLNRIGDEGAKIISEGLKENKNLERLSLASNRLTAVGVKSIIEAVTSHPTLVLLDFGFTKATTTVGEIGNLMGDEGAVALAEMLGKNNTLRSLDILHNNVAQTGLNALRDALRTNTTLTTLNFTQFGRASNEIVKEETKLFLQRNCTLAGDALPSLQQIDYPQHIIDILSVYRTHM